MQIRAAGKRVGSGLVHHRLTADAAVHEAVKHRAGAEAHCAMHAAGESTGGVHGAVRLGSCAVLDCLVNGRICGQAVMDEA